MVLARRAFGASPDAIIVYNADGAVSLLSYRKDTTVNLSIRGMLWEKERGAALKLGKKYLGESGKKSVEKRPIPSQEKTLRIGSHEPDPSLMKNARASGRNEPDGPARSSGRFSSKGLSRYRSHLKPLHSVSFQFHHFSNSGSCSSFETKYTAQRNTYSMHRSTWVPWCSQRR